MQIQGDACVWYGEGWQFLLPLAEKDDVMAAWENTEVGFGVYGQRKHPKKVFRALCSTLRMTQ